MGCLKFSTKRVKSIVSATVVQRTKEREPRKMCLRLAFTAGWNNKHHTQIVPVMCMYTNVNKKTTTNQKKNHKFSTNPNLIISTYGSCQLNTHINNIVWCLCSSVSVLVLRTIHTNRLLLVDCICQRPNTLPKKKTSAKQMVQFSSVWLFRMLNQFYHWS